MATWPAGVPFFNAMNEAERSGPTGNVIRTQMEVGPDKVRRRSTAATQEFGGRSAKMTSTQFATFEAWFTGTIADGALAFEASDPMDCTTKTWRFRGTYRVRRGGAFLYVSASLEILP